MLYFTIRESDFLMNGLMATKREILFYNLRDSKIGWNNLYYLKWHRSVSSIKEFIIYLIRRHVGNKLYEGGELAIVTEMLIDRRKKRKHYK